MSRSDVEADIRETLGLVPGFWSRVPDALMESEWQSFKAIELAETEIPNKYKELTYLNAVQIDYDEFVAEFEQIAAYVRAQAPAATA